VDEVASQPDPGVHVAEEQCACPNATLANKRKAMLRSLDKRSLLIIKNMAWEEFGKDVLHINDKSPVLRDPSRQLNVDGFGKPTVGSLLISLHTTAFPPFARGIRRSGWLDGVYR
jgi:hypothetical protein